MVYCFVDYAYGNDGPVGRFVEYKNAIRYRVQFVVDLLSVFVNKLTKLKIIESMESITASGYCIGGHMAGWSVNFCLIKSDAKRNLLLAGMFGRMLNKKHKNKIRMVLGKFV